MVKRPFGSQIGMGNERWEESCMRCIFQIQIQLKHLIKDGGWDCNALLYTTVPPLFHEILRTIKPVLDSRLHDVWVWQSCATSAYTAASGYKWLHKLVHGPLLVSDWGRVWKLRVSEKLKVFIWLLLHDDIQVNAHRYRCHLVLSLGCMA